MLAVPEAVLRKRAALEPEEWAQIRRHPVVGERILSAAPALEPVARLVRSSYERFDGTGYPDGIRGERDPARLARDRRLRRLRRHDFPAPLS